MMASALRWIITWLLENCSKGCPIVEGKYLAHWVTPYPAAHPLGILAYSGVISRVTGRIPSRSIFSRDACIRALFAYHEGFIDHALRPIIIARSLYQNW
jgi:hypothetical protein